MQTAEKFSRLGIVQERLVLWSSNHGKIVRRVVSDCCGLVRHFGHVWDDTFPWEHKNLPLLPFTVCRPELSQSPPAKLQPLFIEAHRQMPACPVACPFAGASPPTLVFGQLRCHAFVLEWAALALS